MTPLAHLNEQSTKDGLRWTAQGPGGAVWYIDWRPTQGVENVRAWTLTYGHTGYLAHATDKDAARAKAEQIAMWIKEGGRRQPTVTNRSGR